MTKEKNEGEVTEITRKDEETKMTKKDEEEVLLIVNNIPADFHTYDLRRHFADFVETDKFICFHFRHRPEKGKISEVAVGGENKDLSYAKRTCSRVHGAGAASKENRPTSCCLVRLLHKHLSGLLVRYHGHHWQDFEEKERSSRCFISKVKLDETNSVKENVSDHEVTGTSIDSSQTTEISEATSSKNISNSSRPSRQVQDSPTLCNLSPEMLSLPELQPPNLMPKGNIGTSTKYFLQGKEF